VADRDGAVVGLALDTGRELWRASAGNRLSAGAGSDGRFAGVVTRENELVVFEAGAVKWRQVLPTRVVTPPLVAGERVFVTGIDRIVRAFDALDGRRLWTQTRPGEALSLSQAGVIAPYKDTLLVGQGARLAGLDPVLGTVRWDVPIATPRGTNEVERLADLVAPAARVGDIVCARSYQAAVSCVNADRGSLLWTRTVGGDEGVAADAQMVYAADVSDRVTAWRMANGEVAWTSQSFLYRNLSAPAVLPNALVFGDSQGIVHLLSRENGQTLQRINTDGSPIDAAPLVAGGLLLVTTRSGGLFAYRPQ
jgi:outer membrane assembly lipoprotein YfgL